MTTAPIDEMSRLGTRWGRTSVLIVGCFLVIAAVLGAVRQELVSSALFVTQSSTSQFSTSGLEGSDVGLGMTQVDRSTGVGSGSDKKYVLRAGFADGKLDGLCISQRQTVGGAVFTLRLTAGDGQLGTYEVVGKNAELDIVSLRGTNASGTTNNGINLDGRAMLGVAASDITTTTTGGLSDVNPLDAPTTAGWYGIDADRGNMYNLRGDLYDVVIGGPFSLPNLMIKIYPGDVGCKNATVPLPK